MLEKISEFTVSLYLLVLSTDTYNLYKQFEPGTGMKNRTDWSGLKLFYILMVFLKEFFENS